MKKIISIVMVIFLLGLAGCKKEEVLPKANLTISLVYSPAIFYWSVIFGQWYCYNGIVISETNGVGGNITGAKLELIYQNQTYESKNYEGKAFNSYESWTIWDTIYQVYNYGYDTVRISITGKDADGYSFNFGKTFPVSYSGVAKK